MTITRIKQRRGTAAAWTAANPTLDSGEFGVETDTGKIKLGDGSTAWTALNYLLEDAALTGTPTAPTAAPGDNSTKIANTAFVTDAVDNATSSLWVPATSFLGSSALGVPSLAHTATRSVYWLFDAANPEGVFGPIVLPPGWATMHADLYWTNAGAGTGDVVWTVQTSYAADGAAMTAPGGTAVTVTAPVKDTLKVTRAFTGQAITASYLTLGMRRDGQVAGDTLGNDAGAFGVLLTKAS